jgi:chemotaxis protein histidine kinase CheA
VIHALYGPLLHLVRNALAHGIEPPAIRKANGKNEKGTLRLAAAVHADQEPPTMPDGDSARNLSYRLELRVVDDGAGLDLDVILNKARRRGLVPPNVTPSESEIAALIFSPNFSTKTEANALAGRGVGMEVVQQEIANMGGSVDVQSQRGRGTQITLTVPVRTALE